MASVPVSVRVVFSGTLPVLVFAGTLPVLVPVLGSGSTLPVSCTVPISVGLLPVICGTVLVPSLPTLPVFWSAVISPMIGWECSLLARQELTAPPVPRAQSGLRSAPAYWLMSLRPVLVQVL